MPSKICLTVPKNFVGGTLLCCFRNFPLRKIVMDKRGEYQGFPSNFFCLTVPKNSVGEPFCAVFQKISGSEKVYG